jgi:hypothetical protein
MCPLIFDRYLASTPLLFAQSNTMDFIIILIFSLFQLKICETAQIRALILHVYRMGPMGLFQTVISGLIYFQIQTLSNVFFLFQAPVS